MDNAEESKQLRDKTNCNICGLLMPKNTRDVFKHAASLGRQQRLCNVKLATKILINCVLVTQTSYAISLDGDYTTSGCEQLLSQSHPMAEISSCLKSHCKSALIGLEYVVEVNPYRNMCWTSHSFYICLLCEKHCDDIDNILMHLESSDHRILYLKKYFPRAQSLFLRADPCCENWSPEITEYLTAIANRIEALKGRLQVSSCHRTQWNVKSQHFRTEIDLGTHLRETPDLLYDDITSPFTTMEFEDLANDRKPELLNPSRLGLTDRAKKENADKRTTLPFEKSGETSLMQEAVILLSDVSMSETDSEQCEKINGIVTLRAPSKADVISVTESRHRTGWHQKSKQVLLPFDVQVQPVTRNEDEPSTEMPVNPSEEDDDVTIGNEEIVRKQIKSSSNVLNRVVSRVASRHRSRSPKRLQSTRRVTYSSLSRHAVSRSQSRSPKRSRASPSSSEISQSVYRGKAEVQYSSTDDGLFWYDSECRGSAARHRRRQQTLVKQQRENRKNEARSLKIVEEELSAFKERLDRKERIYKKRPEEHPLYSVEWRIFWKRRFSDLEKQGKNPYNHDYRREWFPVWFKQMERLKQREITRKKSELMLKYSDKPTGTAQPNDYSDQDHSDEVKEHASRKNSKNPVQFGWREVSSETKSIRDPKKELRTYHESKEISNVGGSFSHIAKDGVSKDPSTLRLLQVLRMLVALEDRLGSLGPSITTLLSRTLSAERCRPGSSSQLLKENVTWIVDLLDTSKEKLKGLLCAGILDRVQATAASQAVGNVNHFLERSAPTINFSISVDGPTSFDVPLRTNNLQVADLLPSLQWATTIPTTSSSIESCSTGNMEERRPNYSSQFHVGSYSSSLKHTVTGSENDKVKFGPYDQFTGEELKILIANFRTLTASQKHDLINCLRHVEQKYVSKNSLYQSRSVSSSSSPPSSRLPKKCRTYESDCGVSIIAVEPRPSEIRYPSILKMTGLSSVDLKNYGIPLEELKSTLPDQLGTLIFSKITDGTAVPKNPCLTPMNSAHHRLQIGQSDQWPLSEAGNSFSRNSVEIQGSCTYEDDSSEPIVNQQVPTLNQQENSSFCNDLQDPRRNRKQQVQQLSLIPELLDSHGRPKDPVIIPTSPVLSRQLQQN